MISTPILAIGEPTGPIENGSHVHSPALHRAGVQPLQLRLHLSGSAQLLVGPASSLLLADVRAILDARDVLRVRATKEAVGTFRFVQLDERAALDEITTKLLIFFAEPSRQRMASGWQVAAVSSTHVRSFLFVVISTISCTKTVSIQSAIQTTSTVDSICGSPIMGVIRARDRANRDYSQRAPE